MSGSDPEATRVQLELEHFEQVPAVPGTVLLRLSGRWVAEVDGRLAAPALRADDGRRSRRLPMLPGPDDPAPRSGPGAPPWRAAFSAPADLVAADGVRFTLEAGELVVDLPAPAVRVRSAARPAPAAAAEDRERRRLRSELAAERSARADLEGSAAADLEALRARAREHLAAAHAERDRLRDAYEHALAEARAARDAAERRVAVLEEVGAREAPVPTGSDARDPAALRAALAVAEGRERRLRAQLEEEGAAATRHAARLEYELELLRPQAVRTADLQAELLALRAEARRVAELEAELERRRGPGDDPPPPAPVAVRTARPRGARRRWPRRGNDRLLGVVLGLVALGSGGTLLVSLVQLVVSP